MTIAQLSRLAGLVVGLLAALAPFESMAAEPTLSVTIDGKAWSSDSITSVTVPIAGKPVFNMAARSTSRPLSLLNFNLILAAGGKLEGTYDLVEGQPLTKSHGSFTLDAMSGGTDETRFSLVKGAVIIERFDSAGGTVSGHFMATARNRAKTKTIEMTNGAFANVPYVPIKKDLEVPHALGAAPGADLLITGVASREGPEATKMPEIPALACACS